MTLVFALRGKAPAGSAVVRDDGNGVISVAQLHTLEWCRGRGVARELMGHVLRLYQPREVRLIAEPFTREGEKPGAPAEALEAFYASLGFVPAGGSPERRLMVRRARLTGAERSR